MNQPLKITEFTDVRSYISYVCVLRTCSVVAQLSACYESVHDAPAISGDSAPSSAVADLQTALGFYRTTNQPEIALTSTGWVCGNRDENTNQKVKYGRQKNVLLYSFSRL